MADIEFRIVDGPYQGTYAINADEISANDVGDLMAQGGPNLDDVILGGEVKGIRAFAAFVWLVKRRASSKGLPYRQVAEHISFNSVKPIEADGTKESAETLPDPSSSADD